MTVYHSLYSIYFYMEANSSLSAEPHIGAVATLNHRATYYGNSPSYLSVGASLQVHYTSQYSYVCIPIHIHGVPNSRKSKYSTSQHSYIHMWNMYIIKRFLFSSLDRCLFGHVLTSHLTWTSIHSELNGLKNNSTHVCNTPSCGLVVLN
jgi:hypothetical protein